MKSESKPSIDGGESKPSIDGGESKPSIDGGESKPFIALDSGEIQTEGLIPFNELPESILVGRGGYAKHPDGFWIRTPSNLRSRTQDMAYLNKDEPRKREYSYVQKSAGKQVVILSRVDPPSNPKQIFDSEKQKTVSKKRKDLKVTTIDEFDTSNWELFDIVSKVKTDRRDLDFPVVADVLDEMAAIAMDEAKAVREEYGERPSIQNQTAERRKKYFGQNNPEAQDEQDAQDGQKAA